MRWILLTVLTLAVPTAGAAPVPTHLMKPKDDPAVARANFVRLAAAYNAMPPESVAPILKEMVDAGKADVVAEILALMKERNVARVLEAMNDPNTVALLLERFRQLKAQKFPVAPVPQLVK